VRGTTDAADPKEVHVSWWWCLKHSRPEQDPDVDVPADARVGPYDTEEAARGWKEQFEARYEKWEREDEEWREGHAGSPGGS
jgi:hypothetical protein